MMDLVVVVDVVHLEGEAKFLFARIQVSVLRHIAIRDRAETRQRTHELSEIDSVIDTVVSAVAKEGVDDSVSQRIDHQFRYSDEIFSAKCSRAGFVESGESAVKADDLIGGEARFITNLLNLFFAQQDRRFRTHFTSSMSQQSDNMQNSEIEANLNRRK